MVSNTGQISFATTNDSKDRAQAFTTVPNTGGYNLASVGLVFDDRQGADAAVSLCQVDNSNFPTSTCTARTAPGSIESKLRVFTAPASQHDLRHGGQESRRRFSAAAGNI